MTLTNSELRALAREARKLASECVEGTAPYLVPGDWCGCAIGTMIRRAGLSRDGRVLPLAQDVDALLHEDGRSLGLVSLSVLHGNDGDGGPVFPLLALADELDIAAKAAPRESP